MKRRVLLLGATGGIGAAILDSLLEEGHTVAATARTSEDLAALEARGVGALALDLQDPASVAALPGRLDGPLDAIVHSAGLGIPGRIEDLPPAAWTRTFRVNLFGPMVLTGALLERLEPGGRVVLLSTLAARLSLPLYGSYAASKAALEGAVDALRLEARGRGVCVSLVRPAVVKTGFQARSRALLDEHVERADDPRYRRAEARILDRGFAVRPERVARAVSRALAARRPRRHYTVGRTTSLGITLARVMPRPLRDRVLCWWLRAS